MVYSMLFFRLREVELGSSLIEYFLFLSKLIIKFT